MNTLERNVIDYQRGRERAFDYIYKDLAGLAHLLAKRGRERAAREDLAQEAFIGLMVAARTWDPDRGVSFFVYARLHMRWATSKAFTRDVRNDEHHLLGLDLEATAGSDIALGADNLIAALDDDRDVCILEGVIEGNTLETIGAELGISKQAVSLRVKAIQRRVRL